MDIFIYGKIGRDVIFTDVKKAIDEANGKDINIRISSEGGEVYEGYKIYQELKNYKGSVTAYIDGYCMSIATLIALAANSTTISPIGSYLIHNPMASPMMADAKDLIKTAKSLINIEDFLIKKYTEKTMMGREEVERIMNDGREMTAQEAVSLGFIDKIGEPIKAVAYVNKQTNINMEKEQIRNAFSTIINAISDKVDLKNEGEAPQANEETNKEIDNAEKEKDPLEARIADLEKQLADKEESNKNLEAQLEEASKSHETELVSIKQELSKLQNTVLGEAPVAAVENTGSTGKDNNAQWYKELLKERLG